MDTLADFETQITRVDMRKDDRWLSLSVKLVEEFTGGNVVRLAPRTSVQIEPADELAATCTERNWFSGIASGAFYAYRTLKVQRRVVLITNLTGRLAAPDMSALACASARAIAVLLQRELSLADDDLDGWEEVCSDPSANGVKPALSTQ